MLMTHKTKELYVAALTRVTMRYPGFNPLFGISDYELGSRAAFSEIFPDMEVRGELFNLAGCIHFEN